MELTELLKIAAEPHLIASATKANEILARLNAEITDLRGKVTELELAADLHHNKLLQQENKTIALKESEYRVSDVYREFKTKKGLLSDIRAIRRSLQRHCDLLFEQEKYRPKGNYTSGGF